MYPSLHYLILPHRWHMTSVAQAEKDTEEGHSEVSNTLLGQSDEMRVMFELEERHVQVMDQFRDGLKSMDEDAREYFGEELEVEIADAVDAAYASLHSELLSLGSESSHNERYLVYGKTRARLYQACFGILSDYADRASSVGEVEKALILITRLRYLHSSLYEVADDETHVPSLILESDVPETPLTSNSSTTKSSIVLDATLKKLKLILIFMLSFVPSVQWISQYSYRSITGDLTAGIDRKSVV